MIRRLTLTLAGFVLIAVVTTLWSPTSAKAAGRGQPTDWHRYYYPYVYYPHNFQSHRISYDHLYYRYPANRRIPVFDKNWHNPYTAPRPWHRGNHFKLDVF